MKILLWRFFSISRIPVTVSNIPVFVTQQSGNESYHQFKYDVLTIYLLVVMSVLSVKVNHNFIKILLATLLHKKLSVIDPTSREKNLGALFVAS